jgi:hypothetical protein
MLKRSRGWKETVRKVRLARANCFLSEQQPRNVTQARRYNDQRICVLLRSALLRWRSSRSFATPMEGDHERVCTNTSSIPTFHALTTGPHFSGCACASMILRILLKSVHKRNAIVSAHTLMTTCIALRVHGYQSLLGAGPVISMTTAWLCKRDGRYEL